MPKNNLKPGTIFKFENGWGVILKRKWSLTIEQKSSGEGYRIFNRNIPDDAVEEKCLEYPIVLALIAVQCTLEPLSSTAI